MNFVMDVYYHFLHFGLSANFDLFERVVVVMGRKILEMGECCWQCYQVPTTRAKTDFKAFIIGARAKIRPRAFW